MYVPVQVRHQIFYWADNQQQPSTEVTWNYGHTKTAGKEGEKEKCRKKNEMR